MAGIFISYRRKDSAEAAQLIYNRLDARFPRVPVFIDVDEIPPGRDFRTTIDDTLRRCTAVLAVIGPDWVDSRDAAGNRRLDNPADFVRLELESAFRGRVTVIVVLVRGARLPDVHQLPPSLEGLSRCPAVEVRPFPAANADLERLVQVMIGTVPTLMRWRPAYPRVTLVTVLLFPFFIVEEVIILRSYFGGTPTPIPFAFFAAVALAVSCVWYVLLFFAAFTSARLGRVGWVVAVLVSLGYGLIVFGLVGPIKRSRPVAPATIAPAAWRPVGAQR